MKTNEHIHLCRWIQQLKDRGHMASKKRLLIMEALFEQREIADMENFWIELRQKHAISWATFYNFIRLALKENWIEKNSQDYGKAHYQLRTQWLHL